MATLQREIWAMAVHGKTGQEIEEHVLVAGTEYTLEGAGTVERYDGTKETESWILVDGYRYRVRGVVLPA